VKLMMKVIIIDDEYLVRERLKSCIHWNELGYEIAGEASDGEDGLKLVREVKPQLAIVDINMPFIDGLNFSSIVHQEYPDIKIIILTGYSNFEYARSALQAGVTNYLLKPIHKDELVAVLVKLKTAIEKEMKVKNEMEKMKLRSRENDALLKEKFIHLLLKGGSGSLPHDEYNQKMKQYCPNIKEDGNLFVFLVHVDKNSGLNEQEYQLRKLSAFEIVAEVFHKVGHNEITCDMDGRILVIVDLCAVSATDWRNYCLTLGETVKNSVKNRLDITVSIGIGNIHTGMAEISNSYREALIAVKSTIILGNDTVIAYQSLNNKINTGNDLTNLRQSLILDLRLGNITAIDEELRHVFGKIRLEKQSLDNLYLLLSELLLITTDFACESQLEITDFVGEGINPASIVADKETLDHIMNWFIAIFTRMIHIVNNGKQSNSAKTVIKAKEYIDANYRNGDLGLEGIAGNIFINPSYLSDIFKKETGLSIMEYIRECRMNKARELLDKGYQNLIRIAELVGYSDPHYFSKCFKKHFGMSPSKYIETKKP
jgi:two-component system response regulator YesN